MLTGVHPRSFKSGMKSSGEAVATLCRWLQALIAALPGRFAHRARTSSATGVSLPRLVIRDLIASIARWVDSTSTVAASCTTRASRAVAGPGWCREGGGRAASAAWCRAAGSRRCLVQHVDCQLCARQDVSGAGIGGVEFIEEHDDVIAEVFMVGEYAAGREQPGVAPVRGEREIAEELSQFLFASLEQGPCGHEFLEAASSKPMALFGRPTSITSRSVAALTSSVVSLVDCSAEKPSARRSSRSSALASTRTLSLTTPVPSWAESSPHASTSGGCLPSRLGTIVMRIGRTIHVGDSCAERREQN